MSVIERARYRLSLRNPFPPPDRRYRLAKVFVDEGVTPVPGVDEDGIWKLYRFLYARARFRDPEQRIRHVDMRYADLACAFRIYRRKLKGMRPILEAYLLAGENREVIADLMRLSPRTVRWYSRAFYDVEPLRDHREYVVNQLIGIPGNHHSKRLDEATLCKLVAYFRGPRALDELLGRLRGITSPRPAEETDGWLSQQTEGTLEIKQLLAAMAIDPRREKDRAQLLRGFGQTQRAKGRTADAPLSGIEQHVQAMLAEFLWTIGPKELPSPLEEWKETSVELREDEESRLVAGVDLPGMAELKGLQFPLSREISPEAKPLKVQRR